MDRHDAEDIISGGPLGTPEGLVDRIVDAIQEVHYAAEDSAEEASVASYDEGHRIGRYEAYTDALKDVAASLDAAKTRGELKAALKRLKDNAS